MNSQPQKCIGLIKGAIKNVLAKSQSWIWRKMTPVEADLYERTDFESSIFKPRVFYRKAHCYFVRHLDIDLQKHREYFCQEKRGFGEDAFHVLWWLLVRKYQIRNFLEIGVYRGQTISLISLLQKKQGQAGEIVGIGPLEGLGDSVTNYLGNLDYVQDINKNFKHFGLPLPKLIKACSNEPQAKEVITSRLWDCIYIDGNHDYEVALADWKICSESVKSGGLIILDDSGLTSNYRAPLFATAGHPGPSKVALEIDRSMFREILQMGHNRVFQKIA